MLRKTAYILLFALLSTSAVFSQDDTNKDATSVKNKKQKDTTNSKNLLAKEIYKPTVGLGVGMMSFYGDLYSRHAQRFMTSRIGYDLNFSQPLSKSFYLNFNALYGKLGANERQGFRNENFLSEIRMGGVQVMYDFSHLFKTDNHLWRPWISTGVESFEFLSKTDLHDKSGFKYYYWSDGSIRNMDEADPNSKNATELVRDYTYETDIRELNVDGFGKYPERSWAIPIGAGVKLKITDRATFKIGTTFHLTFTDYIDGITNTSTGDRVGTKSKDKFVYSSFSLHYDLVVKSKTDTMPEGYYDDVEAIVFDFDDEDGDGVTDFKDDCHKTPKTAKVDKKGCPVDEDKDWIADYYDEELPTPESMIANVVGVGFTDEMAQRWYDVYYDSTGAFAKNVDLDSAKKPKMDVLDPRNKTKEYTVELARFKGGVPSDIMAFLLSIGDVQSTTVDDETVVYTAGVYDDIKMAIQRRDEFIEEGIKEAAIGYFQGGKYYSIKKEDLNAEVAASGTSNASTNTTHTDQHGLIYRVQLGAYKHPLSPSLFKHVGKVIELKTDDGYFKYVTESYPTLEKAMAAKADVVLEGYSDAFVSAYKDGKRISLSEAGASFENQDDAKNEILDESKNNVNAIDKSLVSFKVQIGALKKATDTSFEERVKEIKDVEKLPTSTGLVRYAVGTYSGYNEAVQAKNALAENGFNDAFVIATFKGEVISIQEALEILGGNK